MPTTMKKRPSRTSWNGRMSVSTWCLNSVSAISMPATKAPRASDRPANSVRNARPSVTRSRFRTNSSSLFLRTTSVSHQRMTTRPPTSRRARSAAALSAATESSRSSTSGVELSAGMITSSGTTARSWNRSTAMTRRPCSLSSSRRSAISLTTIAVELIASAAPSAIALCQPSPQWRPVAAKSEISAALPATAAAIVSTTWLRPRPKTSFLMLSSLGRLNSRPMTNIRKTMPNSAR